MLPALLAQLGFPLLVKAVGAGLSRIDHPAAKGAAEALEAVDAAVGRAEIAPEQMAEANRHVEALARLESEDYRTAITEVNTSLRAEVTSNDPYVRRMRPTFGYIMAVTWLAQMMAVAWVIIADPVQAGAVIAALASLGTIWSVGLAVLGIYVYKRSEEKRGITGDVPATLLAGVARRFSGR